MAQLGPLPPRTPAGTGVSSEHWLRKGLPQVHMAVGRFPFLAEGQPEGPIPSLSIG